LCVPCPAEISEKIERRCPVLVFITESLAAASHVSGTIRLRELPNNPASWHHYGQLHSFIEKAFSRAVVAVNASSYADKHASGR
jgi:hypothetical protein